MADRTPDYRVERRRLEVKRLEHEETIAAGQARLLEIERRKHLNTLRAELANDELDSESGRIRENEGSLAATIADIDSNLAAMVTAAPKKGEV